MYYTRNSFTKKELKQIEKGIEKCLNNTDIRQFLSNVHGVNYETEEYNKLENQRDSYDLMFDYKTGNLFCQEVGWGKSHEMGSMLCIAQNTDKMWEDEIEELLNSLLEE